MCPVLSLVLASTSRRLKNHLAQADQPTVLMRAFWLDSEKRERFIMLNRHWWQLESAGALTLVPDETSVNHHQCVPIYTIIQGNTCYSACQSEYIHKQATIHRLILQNKRFIKQKFNFAQTAGLTFVFDVKCSSMKRLKLQINTSISIYVHFIRDASTTRSFIR